MINEQSRITLPAKAIVGALAGILLLLLALGSCGTVNYGERGVLLRFGAVTGNVKNEGLYFKLPLIDHVEILDIKTKKSAYSGRCWPAIPFEVVHPFHSMLSTYSGRSCPLIPF